MKNSNDFKNKYKYDINVNNSKKNDKRTNYQKNIKRRYTSKNNISKVLKAAKQAIGEDVKENPRKWIKILTASAAVGLAFSIIGGIHNQMVEADNKNTITLEQALENQTLDELGIEAETQQRLYNMQDKIEDSDELANIDLINLSKEIIETQFDVIKEKLARAYHVEEYDITLQAQYHDAYRGVDHITKIMIDGEDKLINNEIPERIKTFIELIGDMQEIEEMVNNKNFDRDYIIDKYKYALEETSKMAASNIYVNKNGELVYEAIKKSEYEEQEMNKPDVSFDVNGNMINNSSNSTSKEDYER